MRNKRLLSSLLIIIMVISTFLSSGIQIAAEEGTEQTPEITLIKTVDELYKIPAGSENHYKLANDIDLENITKVPLGEFKGVFDGAGYSIKNANIISESNYVGLFNKVTNATIKNLTVENATLSNTSRTFVGTIAGLATTSVFENCIIKDSDIVGGDRSGGLCGSATGTTFNNCTVENTQIAGKAYVGSLSGYIIGNSIVSNCNSIENIVGGTNNLGGLIGYSNSTSISLCSSKVNMVNGSGSSVGGLIGYSTGSDISLCFSTDGKATGVANVGGLIGYMTTVNLDQCYSTTDVKATGNYVGGLIGQYYGQSCNVSQCFAMNNIEGLSFVGGLIGGTEGSASYANCDINNSYSISTISTVSENGLGGGLVGDRIKSITNSYSASEIEASRIYPLGSGTITNSYFDGDLLKLTTPESQARKTEEMYNPINYTTWDLEDIWSVDKGNDYPKLKFSISDPVDPSDGIFKMILEINEQFQMSLNEKYELNESAVWVSSDNAIATVDKKGVIKAVSAGNVVITVTLAEENYTEQISILVVEDASYLRLAIDLKVGGKAIATIDDLSNTSLVNWLTKNAAVAEVNKRGTIVAKGKGFTVISATNSAGDTLGQVYIRVRE